MFFIATCKSSSPRTVVEIIGVSQTRGVIVVPVVDVNAKKRINWWLVNWHRLQLLHEFVAVRHVNWIKLMKNACTHTPPWPNNRWPKITFRSSTKMNWFCFFYLRFIENEVFFFSSSHTVQWKRWQLMTTLTIIAHCTRKNEQSTFIMFINFRYLTQRSSPQYIHCCIEFRSVWIRFGAQTYKAGS